MNNISVEKFKQEGEKFLSRYIVEEVMVTSLCDERFHRDNVSNHTQYICAHNERVKCGTKRIHEKRRKNSNGRKCFG